MTPQAQKIIDIFLKIARKEGYLPRED